MIGCWGCKPNTPQRKGILDHERFIIAGSIAPSPSHMCLPLSRGCAIHSLLLESRQHSEMAMTALVRCTHPAGLRRSSAACRARWTPGRASGRAGARRLDPRPSPHHQPPVVQPESECAGWWLMQLAGIGYLSLTAASNLYFHCAVVLLPADLLFDVSCLTLACRGRPTRWMQPVAW
jgi:hypothetical protein